MLMIPLPLCIAALLAGLAVREAAVDTGEQGRRWWIALLVLLAVQETVIGLRFGYGQEWLRAVQPVTAAAIGPLAWLAFTRPPISPRLIVHGIPVVLVTVVASVATVLIDAALVAINLGYAAALASLLVSGPAFAWARFDRLAWMRTACVGAFLWLAVSGLTDAIIVADFWLGSGRRTAAIVGWVTLAALVIAAAAIGWRLTRPRRASSAPRGDDPAGEAAVLEELDAVMRRDKLHLDPQISLTRIARRLGRPVRDVSRAINGRTGRSASVYVNDLRIQEACCLLKETDMPVTQIIYAAGFNTKSNFHREFARVTGTTPSQWRAGVE